MARPTTYSKAIHEKAKEYVAAPENFEDVVPTVAGLSLILGAARSTLYLWAKEHPEFSDTLEDLQAKQERELVVNGLTSIFNPAITKLMLANHNYRDKQELTGANGGPLEVTGVEVSVRKT